MSASAMLHITDGESVAGTLRDSATPGDVSTYGDLMHEGPAPAGLDTEAWRETRARFIAEAGSAIDLNGIDRWLGGVHLKGDKAAWRWDRASERIVSHQ